MPSNITFALVRPVLVTRDGELQVEDSEVGDKETEAVGTEVKTALVVTQDHLNNGFTLWRAENGDTAAWIHFGSNPTAAVGTTHQIFANERRFFTAKVGDKVSVIADS